MQTPRYTLPVTALCQYNHAADIAAASLEHTAAWLLPMSLSSLPPHPVTLSLTLLTADRRCRCAVRYCTTECRHITRTQRCGCCRRPPASCFLVLMRTPQTVQAVQTVPAATAAASAATRRRHSSLPPRVTRTRWCGCCRRPPAPGPAGTSAAHAPGPHAPCPSPCAPEHCQSLDAHEC